MRRAEKIVALTPFPDERKFFVKVPGCEERDPLFRNIPDFENSKSETSNMFYLECFLEKSEIIFPFSKIKSSMIACLEKAWPSAISHIFVVGLCNLKENIAL